MSGLDREAQYKHDPERPTVGMMLIETHSDQLMWKGAADYAREQGVNLICLSGDLQSRPGTEASAPNVVFDLANVDALDGLIVWGSSGAGMLGLFDKAQAIAFLDRYRGLPVVNVEKPLEGVPCVFTDNYQAMRQMIEHVIEAHGRRRVALIRGPAGHFENEERARAWRDALQAYGLVVDERLSSPPCGWLEADGAAAMRLLLEERHLRPGIDLDALVATEAQYAIGALGVLHEYGVAVPGEISVVTFNDIVGTETVVPTVTTVRKQFYESGRKALQMVLDLIAGRPVPDVQDVPAETVIRRSCGCWPHEVSTAGLAGAGMAVVDATAARDQIVPALVHILTGLAPSVSAGMLAPILAHLVSALWSDLSPSGSAGDGLFLSAFESMMRQVNLAGRRVSHWHFVLSALRERVRPLLDAEQLGLAEALWQQARILVGYEMQRAEIAFRLQRIDQSNQMRAFETQMMMADSVEALTRVLVHELPELGVRTAYLALYEDPAAPLNEVRLVMAYRDGVPVSLPAGGVRYPPQQVLPAQVLPAGRSHQLVVLPLYTQEQQLGLLILEIGLEDGSLYNLIRQETSTALQSALAAERRRQVEGELVQERALLRTLIDNIPDYVYIKDRQSRFVINNTAHIRVIGGRSQEELIGKTDLDFFPHEFATLYFQSEQDLMARDRSVIDLEEEVIDQTTGVHLWVLTTKVPLHDADGRVSGFVGITRDITALKQAEASLARYAAEMERRATQVQTASEVAREATAVRELEPLLNRVVTLIAERFELDHTLIFLLDDQEEYAVLMAACGQATQELLSRGLRIRVGQEGIVGHVAATGQFRVVPDVRQDAQYRALLPGARAEAVLPLQVGGHVIGTLDVQSDREGAINDEDVAALSIIADQLAVAIENVRLLDRMQQTVHELEASSAQYTREAWQRLSRGAQQVGYRYRRMVVEQTGDKTAEAQRALELGEPVIVAAQGIQENASSTVAVPVRLRDQVVGVLNLRFAGRTVSPDVVSTIQEVSNRLALSMESARLLRDTQLRAVRDRVLSEASARIGESLDVQTVLQRAVQEMRWALGLKEVEIRVGAAPDHGDGKSQVQ